MGLSKESFLPDEADCAETWRQPRWPEGLKCPDCGSTDVQTRQKNHRNCFHRYRCKECGRWFTDTTGTFLEASNVSLSRWVYLIREMDKKRSINDISKDLDLRYKTVLGMSHKVKEAIYAVCILREGGYEGATSQAVYGLPSAWTADVEGRIIREATRLADKVGVEMLESSITD